MTPIDEALARLLDDFPISAETESRPLLEASGRVLAQDYFSGINVPGHDNSAMDGYALNSADLSGGLRVFPVSQRIAAGQVGRPLLRGTAARIFTGAALPAGADAVAIQENCRTSLADGQSLVEILQTVVTGENIRYRGDDIKEGELLLPAGRRLTPPDIGLLASTGLSHVSVRRPLRVAVMTTGNELVAPGRTLGEGQLYNSNFYLLSALLQNLGIEVVDAGIVKDSLQETINALQAAAGAADCVISSGGVSAGEEDHVRKAVESLGSLSLWKLAIKPGKPFAYGRVEGRPFFGLPGNPVSACMTFLLLVRPCLLRSMGASELQPPEYEIPAGFTLPATGSRQEYLRVLRYETEGASQLRLFPNQSSGVLTSLSRSDGFAIVPPFTAVSPGDMLRYIPLGEVIR